MIQWLPACIMDRCNMFFLKKPKSVCYGSIKNLSLFFFCSFSFYPSPPPLFFYFGKTDKLLNYKSRNINIEGRYFDFGILSIYSQFNYITGMTTPFYMLYKSFSSLFSINGPDICVTLQKHFLFTFFCKYLYFVYRDALSKSLIS